MSTLTQSQAQPEADRGQVRALNGAEDQLAYERLLNAGFEVPAGASFFDDFPVWKESSGARTLRIGAFIDGVLRAAAGVRFTDYRTSPTQTMPVALIGAVVCEPEWRGRGLASLLVGGLADIARNQGAHAAFLWGSEHQLYGRLGFELIGEQIRLPLSAVVEQLRAEHGQMPAIEAQVGWNPKILDWLYVRTEGVVLRPEDAGWIQAHRNIEWWWCGAERSPSAYAAVGRGIDLKGIVHEWGGKLEEARALLAAIAQAHPRFEMIGCDKIYRRYGIDPSRDFSALEFAALGKVLDPSEKRTARELFGPLAGAKPPIPAWFWGLDGA